MIAAIGAPDPIPPSPPSLAQAPASNAFDNALQSLDRIETRAESGAAAVAGGTAADLVSAMTAAEQAGLALQLAVQLRNTALNAYSAVSQIP